MVGWGGGRKVPPPQVRDNGGVTAIWSAPGRVNLIGEHLDYNGGPVLPFALDRRTTARVGWRDDARIRVAADGLGYVELSGTEQPGQVAGWAKYVAAALWVFTDATGPWRGGLDIEISSAVPIGAGLSSSAAVECALLCALDELAGPGLQRREIAALAVRAEREFVGVPCGPMDQLVAMLGTLDHALLIDTGTLDTLLVPLRFAPAGLTLLVIDTGVRHELADSGYADRRAACHEAADLLGHEHLGDADLDEIRTLIDPVLRRRARHVVTEVRRVREVVALLRAGRPAELGELLTGSHRSLAEDFEVSCPELDAAVEESLAAGALGARMTGGGFGGSAIALCRAPDAVAVATRVRSGFETCGFGPPHVWPATPAAGARREPR